MKYLLYKSHHLFHLHHLKSIEVKNCHLQKFTIIDTFFIIILKSSIIFSSIHYYQQVVKKIFFIKFYNTLDFKSLVSITTFYIPSLLTCIWSTHDWFAILLNTFCFVVLLSLAHKWVQYSRFCKNFMFFELWNSNTQHQYS